MMFEVRCPECGAEEMLVEPGHSRRPMPTMADTDPDEGPYATCNACGHEPRGDDLDRVLERVNNELEHARAHVTRGQR